MDNFFPECSLGKLKLSARMVWTFLWIELLELLLEVQAIAEVVAIPF